MELLVAALLVVVVVEAMLVYRFKRRADLLKQAMERDRAVFMREGHPAQKGRPPEPTVGATPTRKTRKESDVPEKTAPGGEAAPEAGGGSPRSVPDEDDRGPVEGGGS